VIKEVVVPVTVGVAASGTSFEFGADDAALNWRQYGYSRNKFVDRPMLYENDAVFGYTDYGWRAESGDWRFFWTDIAAEDLPAAGSSFLVVDNSWEGELNDLDTIILGPTADGYDPSIYGPYTLEQVGRSNYGYIGSGRWLYETSSGGPREMVSAPAQEGLHGIFFHQVFVDGSEISSEFGGSVGLVNLDPGEIASSGAAGTDTTNVTIYSELDLSGFSAEGFGLGGPVTTTGNVILQDDPDDPSTASFATTVDIDHGALLEISTGNTVGSDIDLFVYFGGSLVASSTTSSDEEFVSILFPSDGTYTIEVHGWSVPGGSDTFDLTINAVQGYDITVDNLPASVPAGGTASFDVTTDTTGFAPGTYSGLVLVGPAEAPGLLQVPVTVTVE
jgi:hypothetical protein